MFWKWLPYKYILTSLARAHGLIDPVKLYSQFSKLGQPSEVAIPLELLRSGAVFHARGILNTRTIQNNLDWVWPFWVQRQFNPLDQAFLPRSLSLSHINLSNRNWTAVGLPDCAAYPIIDPRGLVTPFYDGWSLDGWIITPDGKALLPPKLKKARQRLLFDGDRLVVETTTDQDGLRLRCLADVVLRERKAWLRVRYVAESEEKAHFVLSLRPFNPEGVSFVKEVSFGEEGLSWTINGIECGVCDRKPDRRLISNYGKGDVYLRLLERQERKSGRCEVGMITAAAVFDLDPGRATEISLEIDLARDPQTKTVFPVKPGPGWDQALESACKLRVPDEKINFLYEAAVRAMVLHAPYEIYPGPFYYKRFWFRDAVFILQALLCIGLIDRAKRVIDHFPARQKNGGYFQSQEGEWDSNGQVMWIMERYADLTGDPCDDEWIQALVKAGEWIKRKRLPSGREDLHGGLFPAGFSAEHLGANDYYYWDDLWGVAGLRAGAELCESRGMSSEARLFRDEAEDFMAAVEDSIGRSKYIRRCDAISASPYRRMDSGAVGSLVGGYPLQLWPARDPKLLATMDYFLENCFIDHAFFQDMNHSGLNIYLSLHCAQVLLRAGDRRFFNIVKRVAELASPTGQWPEAIHPQTLAGCMGDGQHIWAAAEWVMTLRNMFAREEGDSLALLQGLPAEWLKPSETIEMGPIHTSFGPITVQALVEDGVLKARWVAQWRRQPAEIVVCPFATERRVLNPSPSGEVALPLPSKDFQP